MSDIERVKETVSKDIRIDASREQVWQALLGEECFRAWSSSFAPGCYADTTWEEGARVEIKGPDESGLFGKIVSFRPLKIVSMKYQGTLVNGSEETETPDAKQWQGCSETYHLSEVEGGTILSIEQEVPVQYVHALSDAWDEALKKIKSLAEGTETYEALTSEV